MYIETWLKIECPCGKANWLCPGPADDLTDVGVDGFECWSCKGKFALDDECSQPHFDKGRKSPVE